MSLSSLFNKGFKWWSKVSTIDWNSQNADAWHPKGPELWFQAPATSPLENRQNIIRDQIVHLTMFLLHSLKLVIEFHKVLYTKSWCGSTTSQDKPHLERVVCTVGPPVIGCCLPTIASHYNTSISRKATLSLTPPIQNTSNSRSYHQGGGTVALHVKHHALGIAPSHKLLVDARHG